MTAVQLPISDAEREARNTMPKNSEGHIVDPRHAPPEHAEAAIAAWDLWLQENSYRDEWLRGLNAWIIARRDGHEPPPTLDSVLARLRSR